MAAAPKPKTTGDHHYTNGPHQDDVDKAGDNDVVLREFQKDDHGDVIHGVQEDIVTIFKAEGKPAPYVGSQEHPTEPDGYLGPQTTARLGELGFDISHGMTKKQIADLHTKAHPAPAPTPTQVVTTTVTPTKPDPEHIGVAVNDAGGPAVDPSKTTLPPGTNRTTDFDNSHTRSDGTVVRTVQTETINTQGVHETDNLRVVQNADATGKPNGTGKTDTKQDVKLSQPDRAPGQASEVVTTNDRQVTATGERDRGERIVYDGNGHRVADFVAKGTTVAPGTIDMKVYEHHHRFLGIFGRRDKLVAETLLQQQDPGAPPALLGTNPQTATTLNGGRSYAGLKVETAQSQAEVGLGYAQNINQAYVDQGYKVVDMQVVGATPAGGGSNNPQTIVTPGGTQGTPVGTQGTPPKSKDPGQVQGARAPGSEIRINLNPNTYVGRRSGPGGGP